MDTPVDDRWLEDLYPELHSMAQRLFRGERIDHTLSATAVVHEAFLRLREQRSEWRSRQHFLSVAALTMRRVLTDHARSHVSERRGGGRLRLSLADFREQREESESTDWLNFEEALDALEQVHARAAQVVQLRFFLGLSVESVAKELKRSVRSVHDDWAFARAFLRRELSTGARDVS